MMGSVHSLMAMMMMKLGDAFGDEIDNDIDDDDDDDDNR